MSQAPHNLHPDLSASRKTSSQAGTVSRGPSGYNPLDPVQDDGRADLPAVLPAGEECIVQLPVRLPDEAGSFILDVDLVHEGITWFRDRGSTGLRLPMTVSVGEFARPSQDECGDDAPCSAYDATILDVMLDPIGLVERPDGFPMYGVERNDVLDVLQRAGGRVAHIVEDDHARPEWVGYKYFVVKDRG